MVTCENEIKIIQKINEIDLVHEQPLYHFKPPWKKKLNTFIIKSYRSSRSTFIPTTWRCFLNRNEQCTIVFSSILKASLFSAIFEKLDSENCLLWCQQVEPVIKVNCLHHYLNNPTIPPKFFTIDDSTFISVNPNLKNGRNKISFFFFGPNLWCCMTRSITCVIGCKNFWQLWDKIHVYFQVHKQAK